jgi:hypothetical protein
MTFGGAICGMQIGSASFVPKPTAAKEPRRQNQAGSNSTGDDAMDLKE